MALVAVPIRPANAVTPPPTVFISPAVVPEGAARGTVVVLVNVSDIPAPGINGFDVQVKADPGAIALGAASNGIGPFIIGGSESINCVDGGTHGAPGNIGCKSWDGPGISHEAVTSSFFSSGSGELFSITYTASGVTKGPNSPVALYNDTLFNGTPTPVVHVTVSGTYGPTALADFSIFSSPPSQSIGKGLSGSVSVKLTSLNGFASTINLKSLVIPSSPGTPPTVGLSQNSVTLAAGASQNVTLTINTSAATTAGPYTVLLTGLGPWPAGLGLSLTGTPLAHPVWNGVVIVTPDFGLAPHPATLTSPTGSTNSSTITVSSINFFSGTVSFTVSVKNSSNLPTTAVTAVLNMSSVTLASGASHNVTLMASSTTSTPAGVYTASVTGSATILGATQTHVANVAVNVLPFTISASPTSLPFPQGSSGTSTITVNDIAAYSVNVTLGSSVVPFVVNGPQALLSNSTLMNQASVLLKLTSGGSLTATLSVSTTAGGSTATPLRFYTVSVIGSISGVTRSTQVTVPLLQLVSVVVGTNGNLYWNQFGGTWLSWAPLGGQSPSPPSLCPSGPTTTELLVRGSDSQLYHKTFSATTGTWSAAWDKNPTGITIDQPVCAVIGTTLYVVVRGASGELWFTTEALSTRTWAASWTDLLGFSPSTPALAATPAITRLDLVVRGTDNQIFHKAFTSGAWAASWDTSNRSPVPDKTLATPAIVSDGSQLHVVVIGTEGNLWYATLSFAGAWSTYQSLVGSTPATPDLVIDSAGTLHLVVQGNDGAVYEKAKPSGGSWDATWSFAGGITVGRPAVATQGTTLSVVTTGADAKIWYNTLVGATWSGWVFMNGAASMAPSVSTP